MSSISEWGRTTWIFFHTIVCKMKNASIMGPILFAYIQRLCALLPCPDCSQHAKAYLSKYSANQFTSQIKLVSFFFMFHNVVNQRLHKGQFLPANLTYYQSLHLIERFNQFAKHFHTNGNSQLMTENFHRQRVLAEFRTWFMRNLNQFHLGSTLPVPVPVPVSEKEESTSTPTCEDL
jgi:hypothetical protein